MDIVVIRAALADRPVLRHLSEFYMYDMSEYDPDIEINLHGTFDYTVDRYWQDTNRVPFLIYVDERPSGFVLVKRGAQLAGDPEMMDMSEFFIMRRHRRRGIGRYVAEQIFDLFPARWEVRQFAENNIALLFWRSVIEHYTGGSFEEHFVNNNLWNGTVHYFDNSGA
jgi:predicted acetyltransferase